VDQVGLHLPRPGAVRRSAEHGRKSPEAQVRLRRILLVARVDVAILFVIMHDMVAKPFS
jgi:hypothetical protein